MPQYGVVPREAMLKMSGLELMQGLVAGKYPWPPIMKTLD
jgi:hypothetical protein